MVKVVITDSTFPNTDPERRVLEPAGCEVVLGKENTERALIELTRDADAIITQFAKLTPIVIGNMKKVKVIVRNGIGYDNIDVDAARQHGIPVCNIPDYCINEVADQTLAFIWSSRTARPQRPSRGPDESAARNDERRRGIRPHRPRRSQEAARVRR